MCCCGCLGNSHRQTGGEEAGRQRGVCPVVLQVLRHQQESQRDEERRRWTVARGLA